MADVIGAVEAAAQNAPWRYGLRIRGQWYDGLGMCPARKGDVVRVAYEEDGDFRNVVAVELCPQQDEERHEPQGRQPLTPAEERMLRCVALKAAASARPDERPAYVVALAELFEKWLKGQVRLFTNPGHPPYGSFLDLEEVTTSSFSPPTRPITQRTRHQKPSNSAPQPPAAGAAANAEQSSHHAKDTDSSRYAAL